MNRLHATQLVGDHLQLREGHLRVRLDEERPVDNLTRIDVERVNLGARRERDCTTACISAHSNRIYS